MTTSTTPSSSPTHLRIGTRASALAVTQSSQIANRLRELTGVETSIVTVSTEGDTNTAALTSFGGQGVFIAALREALVNNEVDVAVHSLKDLPTAPDPRLEIAAVPRREDPRDALIARDGLSLTDLPAGSRIGTGSPRREAQLRALGLPIDVQPIRGNVDTRIGKVTGGEVDAIVLARAGLLRLDRGEEATEVLDPLQMLPAPGQGALACECRSADEDIARQLGQLDDPHTRAAVTAERSLLATLEAGCSAPVGALAEVAAGELGDELWLRAVVCATTGSPIIRLSATGPVQRAERTGERLAAEMLAEGAAEIVAAAS